MLHQSNYPPIGSQKGLKAPVQILEKINNFPNIEKHIIGDTIKIEGYKKSFFRNVKVLDVTIQKVPFTDEATQNFDRDSNGKIFGFVVIENGKETYRALYDMGVFQSCITTLKTFWLDSYVEKSSFDFAMANMSYANYDSQNALQGLHDYIEYLFE